LVCWLPVVDEVRTAILHLSMEIMILEASPAAKDLNYP